MKPLSILIATLFCCSVVHAQEGVIFDTISGEKLKREQLLEILSRQDYVLLGELHDNQEHHRLRGELIKDLHAMRNIKVVAEHLELGHRLQQSSGNLLADLERVGFDAKGWNWPIHEGLFAPVVGSGIPLSGGNISRETARNTVRQGKSALPAALVSTIEAAPLEADAQTTLDSDLLQSHCGHLPSTMLEGLRLAQRARDAAMFEVMQFSKQTQRSVPVALVAGNGHVRLDYGVPSLIRKIEPDARFVSVGFTESTSENKQDLTSLRLRYNYVWSVETTENRQDPCLTFKKMKPAVSEATK